MKKKSTVLIIPTCTDLNRGDQALVLETKKIIDTIYEKADCYMMSTGETIQCEAMGLKKFSDILKHPSRFSKKKANINYNLFIKLKWGSIALFDFLVSKLILNKVTRTWIFPFLKEETKKSLKLYEQADSIFVKGGGFLHDYSKGPIGWYTIYYQTYHIRLALNMKKKVCIMPNSYGPFKNKKTAKMVNSILDQCQIVIARESISASKETNTLHRDLDLYPDLAFFLDKKQSTYEVESFLHSFGIQEKKDSLIAITVRPYRFYSYPNPEEKYLEYKKSFVTLIQYLVKQNFKILLVVHTRAENDHENDERCIDEILSMLDNKTNVFKLKDDRLNCYDLKKIYGFCDYVIGTRFHSVIFSLEQKIPCIAVTYGGNKGDGIMKDLGLSKYAIPIGELNGKILIQKFKEMTKNQKEMEKKIEEYLTWSQKSYLTLIEKIKGVLK